MNFKRDSHIARKWQSIGTALSLALTASVYAEITIAQWGISGGDSGIVTSNLVLEGDGKWTTYTPGDIVSPSVGPDYYPSNSGKTPSFNNARSNGWGTRTISDDATGDTIQFGKNAASDCMVVWENLLHENGTLSSIEMEMKSFGDADAVDAPLADPEK